MNYLYICNDSDIGIYCPLCGKELLLPDGIYPCHHLLYAVMSEDSVPLYNILCEDEEQCEEDEELPFDYVAGEGLDLEEIAEEKGYALIVYSDSIVFFSLLFDFTRTEEG